MSRGKQDSVYAFGAILLASESSRVSYEQATKNLFVSYHCTPVISVAISHNRSASSLRTVFGIGIATGAVGAACARAGIGDVGRIGTGSLPEGEICRDIVFGAGGGTGELLRTSVGAGGSGPELGTVIGVGAAMREAGIPGGVTTTGIGTGAEARTKKMAAATAATGAAECITTQIGQ